MASFTSTKRVLPGTGGGTGVFLTTGASLLWGTTLVATGIGLRYTNPYNLLFLRFLAASATIVIIGVLFSRRLNVRTELGRRATWILGGMYALGFVFQYVGQDFTSASDATLLSNLAPILVPVVAYAILRERVSIFQTVAVGVGILGLVLIASPNLQMGSGHPTGDIMLLAASVCYAFFIVLSKRFNAVTVESAFGIVFSVTVLLAPVAILLGGLNPLTLSIDAMGWISIAYLGVPCSVLAISLYLKGLNSITASQSATLLLVELLTGLLLAALMLGETLGLLTAIGAASISFAVFLSSRHRF